MRIVRFIMPVVLALALAACSEPTPTPSPTPVPPTPTPTATATPILVPPAPTATPIPPTPTPTPEAFSLTVDSETTWGDAFDSLTATEQGCIRDAVDGDALTQGLEQPIVTDEDTTEWDTVAFGCIVPETARAIFLSGFIAWLRADGIDVSADYEACLHEVVTGVDIRELVGDTDSPAAEQAAYEMLACVPDLLIDVMFQTIGDAGVELEPTDEQIACLREWVASNGGDVLSVGDVPIGVLGCMADALVDVVVHAWLDEGTAEVVGEERACVQESLEGLLERSPESLDDADAAFLFTGLTFDLLACLPNTLWEQELLQHPSVLWQYDTDTEPYAPVMRGTRLYTSAGNYVHAVDTASGERLWRYGGTFANHSPPTESNGTVYVGWSSPNDGTLLVALDGADGSVLWRASTDYGVALQPVVSGRTVVAGSYNGPVFAVDAETGTPAWESTTYKPTWDSPIADGGTVYALAGAATAYAFDAATGDVRWEYVANGAPTTMTLADGVLYVASDVPASSRGDVLVEAIDAFSGEGLWEFTLRDVDPELVVADGLMYARAYDGDNLIALDAETGAEVWRFDNTPVSSPPVVSYGVVYVGSSSGSIFAFDADTGELLNEYGPVSHVYIGSLTVGDDVVYAASGDGRLYAVNLVMADSP